MTIKLSAFFVIVNLFIGFTCSTRLYKVQISNVNQLKFLQNTINSHKDNVNTMLPMGPLMYDYDITVDDEFAKIFEELLTSAKIPFKLTYSNMINAIPEIHVTPLEWTSYHNLRTIYTWMDELVKNHSSSLTPFTIGYSYQGRPIRGLYLRKGFRFNKKAIILNSNIHAIEWISSAAGTCFFDRLLHSNEPELKYLRETYDWYFLPMLNPDGYAYTQEVNPLWRKNRRPNGFSNSTGPCFGIDLNRNFNFAWKTNAYNVDEPCDHWFGGTSPASEPEVQAMQKFFSELREGYVRIHVSLHSYGNLILLPYGHTSEILPCNYNQMMNISRGFAEAARIKYGTDFRYGPTGNVLYPVAGALKDYAYGVVGIPYSITIELRDQGEYGFFLPGNQILEVCDEFTDGFIGMVRAAEAEGLFN